MAQAAFSKSAKRHYDDACFLEVAGRIPNAGQLFGFAAECGIKAILPLNTSGTAPVRPFREHIHVLTTLINQINSVLQGRGTQHYLSMIPNIIHFIDWNTDHRYCDERNLPNSLPNWKIAAEEVMLMLQQADMDGMTV